MLLPLVPSRCSAIRSPLLLVLPPPPLFFLLVLLSPPGDQSASQSQLLWAYPRGLNCNPEAWASGVGWGQSAPKQMASLWGSGSKI